MSPYPDELKRRELVPSQDPPGFDRVAYQPIIRAEVVAFLGATLGD
jgi:hypothetical protein